METFLPVETECLDIRPLQLADLNLIENYSPRQFARWQCYLAICKSLKRQPRAYLIKYFSRESLINTAALLLPESDNVANSSIVDASYKPLADFYPLSKKHAAVITGSEQCRFGIVIPR